MEFKEIENKTDQRAGFVAIVGRPNVGKSSILNRLIGQKVAIVSKRPQTTRTRIMGVVTKDDCQLVFIDTPGLTKPKNLLGDFMVKSVTQSVSGVDACLLVVEAGQEISKADLELIEKFKAQKIPAILAINKIDLAKDKTVMMEQIKEYSEQFDFAAVMPVSAKTGESMPELFEELKKFTAEGGFFFPEDTLTDQPERVMAAEMVREKLLRLLDKEVPHGTAAVTEKMKERQNAEGKTVLDIDVTVYCEKASHKGIIIGKNGETLKKIGTSARRDMERFFDCKVNLQLWVKVKEDWRQRPNTLHSFGFNERELKL